MNKTGIEWARNPDGSPGYTLNPLSGCRNHTPEGLCLDGLFPCYAYKLAHGRLKSTYLANNNWAGDKLLTDLDLFRTNDPFYPRFWEERLQELPITSGIVASRKGIFVCDMGDLFGMGIPEEWTHRVLQYISEDIIDRFYILTKQAQELIKWSPFPENCLVGVTATNVDFFVSALDALYDVKATVKFLSLEPLLDWHIKPDILEADLRAQQLDWLIIGACTGSFMGMVEISKRYPELTLMPWGKRWTLQPPIEWLREIVDAADKAGVRVFLKDNLLELVNYHSPETDFAFKDGCYRQEMPDPLIRERTKEK